MADAELAVSLAMASLLDLLSNSKDIIPDRSLTDQISGSIKCLQRIMNNRRHGAYHIDDHRDVRLQVTARGAEKAAQRLLVQLLQDHMSKSQLGRFFSRPCRVGAREIMAYEFREKVTLPFQLLEPSWPAHENGQQHNGIAYQENTRERVESDIVGRDQSVSLLVKNLIGPTTPRPAPPPADPNAPPPPPADANAARPPPEDPNAPPPPPPDANAAPPPPVDPNAPPPVPNAPPPPPADANAAPPPPVDPNAPPPDPNAPPPPPADANAAPPPPVDPNAPPPDPNTPLSVIAVVGSQNCGKTALVRHVFNMLTIRHHFDCRAWVHVDGRGSESWTESLLVEMLLQMPVRDQLKDLKHKKKFELIEELHRLLMEKRYLIVLDNLGVQPFNDFLKPFVDSNNGSRVIVTSTNKAMQTLVDRRVNDLPLCPDFTSEDCKKLLRVSITGNEKLELEMTTPDKETILRKCDGSPAVISLLGGLLSTVENNKRLALVARLGESPNPDHFLRLSFDELPYEMKPCVLYMSLFPKESEVPTRRLFQLWAAEGLVLADAAADGSVRVRSAEDCFLELERRKLIRVARRKLDRSARSCCMASFLHDFFRQKAQALALLQIQHSPNAEQNAPCQPNQGQNTATGHYDYMVRHLRSVASFNSCKPGTHQARDVQDLLKSLVTHKRRHLLRVLDLEGVYKPVLPEDFGNTLSNLRYLGLRRTALDSIPESVGNLLLLETLDLKHTNITKVTSAIWNAKNLRHLYLSEASFDQSIPRHISSKSKLETLWGLFIESDKSPMIPMLEKLKSLKKLGVTCRPGAASAVARCISKLTGLKSLRLRSRDLFGQPAVLSLCDMTELTDLTNLYLLGSLRPEYIPCSVLPQKLKRLTLSMLGCSQDPMPVLQTLNHLIDLRLLARSSSTKKLHCNGGFPELCVLKIWMLDMLEEFVINQGAMVKLEELDIRQCGKLGRVAGLDHINSLKSLRLTKVREVLDPGGEDGSRIRVHPATLVKTTGLLPKNPTPAQLLDIYEGGVPDETA